MSPVPVRLQRRIQERSGQYVQEVWLIPVILSAWHCSYRSSELWVSVVNHSLIVCGGGGKCRLMQARVKRKKGHFFSSKYSSSFCF